MYDAIILYATIPSWSYKILYLSIPAIGLVSYVLLTKLSKFSFRRQGYKKPAGITALKCILLGIAFIIIYILIFLTQGFFGSFGSLNFPSGLYSLLFRMAIALTYGLLSESIFRGYIFRNLTRSYGMFTSLYISSILFSLHTTSISDISSIIEDPVIYVLTRIVPLLALGLFLGFFFYKIRWSLLGPLIFRIGLLFFFEPSILISVSSVWWMALTFEMLAFAVLILLVDTIVAESRSRRKRYGLED
jgi:membrane protease YdiL (CAAX protease family)